MSDDDSDDEEEDVESDAATAGSSVSESRERVRLLGVSNAQLSRVPSPAVRNVPGVPPAAEPAALAAAAAAAVGPVPHEPSLNLPLDDAANAASRADRDAMPPPPPTAPVLIPGSSCGWRGWFYLCLFLRLTSGYVLSFNLAIY